MSQTDKPPFDLHIALVGYGEVGKIFAAELIARGARISFFDILLADDHTMIVEALQHLLATEFDVVGTVSDGRAFLQAAQAAGVVTSHG